MTVPIWAWAGTFAVFAMLLLVDLALTRNAVGLRTAARASALWIAAALAFGGVLWLWRGPATAGQYFAGYLLEKALSVDNVFVFVMLFASLQVPAGLQRRVLHLGVVGALVLRGGFIAAGGALIAHVGWIFYAFGALVVLAGVRMFRSGDPGEAGATPRAGTWPRAACAGSCRSPTTTPATASSCGPAGRPSPRPCSWPWWPSRSPTWCSRSIPSRRSSASPVTCSWCSRPTPSPSSACGRSTSCWPARWTGSPTSSRASRSCWCSSA